MIKTVPTNTTLLCGSTLVLKCGVDANPGAHAYNIYFNGNFIGSSSSGVFNISVKEDGEYTCVPVNKLGIGSNGSVSVDAVVSPVAEVVPQAGTVEEGGNIALICNSSGVPSPSVVWTQVGTVKVLPQNNVPVVENVAKPGTPDSVIQYQCTASNGVGTPATAVVNITVHYSAEIVTNPKDQVLWVGEKTTLSCDAVGKPVPNITSSGENATVVHNKKLVVNSSRITYFKIYTCMAFNGIQTPVSVNATVMVLARPCSHSPFVNGNCTDIKTPPSYRCTCPSGYQGRNCNQQITKETDRVRGKVTLERQQHKYHPDYKNHSSEMYKELSNNFMENMTALYQNENQFGHVTVNDIYNGTGDSIMVNFTLVFFKGNNTVDELLQVLKKSVQNGSVYSIPVESGTLRLTLISEFTIPCCTEHFPIDYQQVKPKY